MFDDIPLKIANGTVQSPNMELVIPLDVSSFPFLNLIMKLNIFIQFQAATPRIQFSRLTSKGKDQIFIAQQDYAEPVRTIQLQQNQIGYFFHLHRRTTTHSCVGCINTSK